MRWDLVSIHDEFNNLRRVVDDSRLSKSEVRELVEIFNRRIDDHNAYARDECLPEYPHITVADVMPTTSEQQQEQN